MAERASFSLAYKARSAFGTPATAPFTTIPVASWDPALNFARVEDNTIDRTGFVKPGRAGTVTLTPTFGVPFRPGTYDELLGGLFDAAWATNVLTMGTARSITWFDFEDRQEDEGFFIRVNQSRINSLTLGLAVNGLVTSDWGIVGLGYTALGTGTSNPTAATVNEPFDTWSGTFTLGGVSTLEILALTLNINLNLEPRFRILNSGNRAPNRVPSSNRSITGEMTLALRDRNRLDDIANNTLQALSFQLAFGTLTQTWVLGSVLLTSFGAPVTEDAERVQTVGFTAGPTGGGTAITLTRAGP